MKVLTTVTETFLRGKIIEDGTGGRSVRSGEHGGRDPPRDLS